MTKFNRAKKSAAAITALLLFSATAAQATPVASTTADTAYEQWLLQQAEQQFKTCQRYPYCGNGIETAPEPESTSEAPADKP